MNSFPIIHKDDHWKIWFKRYVNGELRGSGVWIREYKHKSSAVRAAKRFYDHQFVDWSSGITTTYEWIVSKANPWTKGEA